MRNDMFKAICGGLALAMGVAVIVLNVISPLSLVNAADLLAIGIVALGIFTLQK